MSMDELTIRQQLAEFKARLGTLDDERQALQDIVKGYENLLRTMHPPDIRSDAPIDFPARKDSQVVGAVSMRSAVRRVLRSADRPMHSRDILLEARKLGASTNAKEPVSVVDLVILGLAQKGLVEKVSPRVWQWKGGADTED